MVPRHIVDNTATSSLHDQDADMQEVKISPLYAHALATLRWGLFACSLSMLRSKLLLAIHVDFEIVGVLKNKVRRQIECSLVGGVNTDRVHHRPVPSLRFPLSVTVGTYA